MALSPMGAPDCICWSVWRLLLHCSCQNCWMDWPAWPQLGSKFMLTS